MLSDIFFGITPKWNKINIFKTYNLTFNGNTQPYKSENNVITNLSLFSTLLMKHTVSHYYLLLMKSGIWKKSVSLHFFNFFLHTGCLVQRHPVDNS